jgi:hypothetical protein
MAGPPSPSNRPGNPTRAPRHSAGRQRAPAASADNQRRPNVQPSAGSGCFVGTSLIWTPNGDRPIQEIVVGDSVLSWQTNTRSLVVRRVKKVLVHRSQPIWTLRLDGRIGTIRTTACHTVLTAGGWVKVDRLTVGDHILQVGGSGLEIKGITGPSSEEDVYNLHTRVEHNFIVDGVIAHNFTVLRRTRTLLHRLVFDGVEFERALPQFAGELSQP